MATQLTSMLTQPLHSKCWEHYIRSLVEIEHQTAPLVSKKVFGKSFKQLELPANIYTPSRKDSNKAGEKLFARKAGFLRRYQLLLTT